MTRQKGFSLVEMMVAMGILAVIVAAGFSAMEYFNKQTKSEFKKLDDIQEFTLLTKDISKFVEGAGISTAYLNMPIQKECDASTGRPCLRKMGPDPLGATPGDFLNPATSSDFPAVLSENSCVQFYRDSFGKMVDKDSFPGTKEDSHKAKTKTFNDFRYDIDSAELYATWELRDENSAPFMLMKRRGTQDTLQLSQLIRRSDPASQYSFFYSDSTINNFSDLVGYPFLIYSSLFLDQFSIKIVDEVVSCSAETPRCNEEKVNGTKYGNTTAVQDYPDKYYMIKFRMIGENDPFFKEISDALNTPGTCLSSWGTQNLNQLFFPTKVFSLKANAGVFSDLSSAYNADEMKVQSLAHFYGPVASSSGGMVTEDVKRGIVNALPIDIVRYKVKVDPVTNKKQLVSELFYALGNKEKVKINELKAPFYFARRLGTQELSLWYNPPKKQ